MQHAQLMLLKQLSANSGPYRDPLATVEWARLDTAGYWLPEPALSLYGLPEYDGLPAETRRRMSQYEFINIMHTGLWLERVFLQRLSRTLSGALARAEYEYFLHELREETGHSLMFLKVIEKSALSVPEGAWRAPRIADWMARHAPSTSALFWLAVVIGEDVPDKFNRYVRSEAAAINPAVAQICTLHIVDEARHIAAARVRFEAAIDRGAWRNRLLLTPLVNLLLRQLVERFYLPPARFYELAGLAHGNWWRRMAAANPVHRSFVAQRVAPTLRMLEGYGFKARL